LPGDDAEYALKDAAGEEFRLVVGICGDQRHADDDVGFVELAGGAKA
jgi:hypothetical protein